MRRLATTGVVVGVLVAASVNANAGDCALLSVGGAYGRPTKLALFVEGGCGVLKKPGTSMVFGGQIGVGGVELSAGLGRAAGEGGAVNLRAAVIRTWSGSGGMGRNSTLVGGRLEYSILGGVLSANGSVLMPVAGGSGKSVHFTWGIGVGIPVWIFSWPGIGHIEV